MSKNFCFCNMTAFEILRRLEEIPSVAYERNAREIALYCGMSSPSRAQTFLESVNIDSKNSSMHLLTANLSLSSKSKGVVRHIVTTELPSYAVFQLDEGVYCTTPEETYLNLAATLARETQDDLLFKAEAMLALYGMELCGLFYLGASTDTLLERNKPLVTKNKLTAYLDKCTRRPGVELARKSLVHIEDRMRSPMEAACALLLCRERRIGSIGLPQGEANCPVETSEGIREVDRLWKKYGLGYEYQGREYHTAETRRQEDRRRNALLGSGITIMNIWYEDLAQPRAFSELAATLSKKMGKRLRIRSESFAWKQQVLRSVALPSLNRFA